jgi:hypothetical protein
VKLSDLAKLPPNSTAAFISPDMKLDVTIKSGYTVLVAIDATAGVNAAVTLAAATCNTSGTAAASSYYASAVPVTLGSTGQRAFATDTRGTIFYDNTGVAPINPIPTTATPLQ